MTRLQRHRLQAAELQDRDCYYCKQPMWVRELETLEHFSARTGRTRKQSQLLRATAEHLAACCDGGTDAKANIVAACLTCNRRRHQRRVPKSAQDYIRYVRGRISRGGWFPWNGRARKAKA